MSEETSRHKQKIEKENQRPQTGIKPNGDTNTKDTETQATWFGQVHAADWRLRIKGKGLDTFYSATYMSQTRDQQRFTISEVAADWHEPMVPQRITWPSIARANGQLDPRCS